MLFSTEQKNLFRQWSKTKRQIAVIVRFKEEFFGDLEDLKKPEDIALIAFVPQKSTGITERSRDCFDLILLYDVSCFCRANAVQSTKTNTEFDHFDDVEIPDLDSLGHELKDLVDLEKLHLFYSDEFVIAPVCKVRETLRLKGKKLFWKFPMNLGAYLEDLEHVRNKDKLKEFAIKNKIPTASSLKLNFEKFSHNDVSFIVKFVEKRLGKYPMFRRPISLAGCIGSEIVNSKEELNQWIHECIEANDANTYLLEEYLRGREFLAVGVLLSNGTYIPLVLKYLEYGWSNVLYMETGRPIPVLVDTFHNIKEEFPDVLDFVKKVVKAFDPPRAQIFSVQGFQLTAKKNDYYLVELTHRPAGPRTNSVCYKTCGISQETACIMANIDENYLPSVNPDRPHQPKLALWFPQREGFLREYTPLPGRENVKSELKAKWLKPAGSHVEKPKDINSHILILTLFNLNRDQLLKDAKWIADNWRPQIQLEEVNTL